MSQDTKQKEKLFNEFPPVSKEKWKEQVVKDLKGREFEKIIWNTYEDIDVMPFYTEQDLDALKFQTNSYPGEFPFVRGESSEGNDWKINQEINHQDIGLANQLAKSVVNSGADSVSFVCLVDNGEYVGVPIQNKNDMTRLLDGLDIEKTAIHFQSGNNSLALFSLYINEAKRKGIDLKALAGSLNCDPFKELCLNGSFLNGEEDSFNVLRELVSYSNNLTPNFKVLKVNGSYFHESGASITQELAFTLASGVEYLDRLTEMDLTIDQISQQMLFCFSVSSNYFMEIAKLRAARLLWAQIVEQFEPKNESSKLMTIEVNNSSWNKTQYDPFVNMLRGTVETMAGALGGAGLITVRPFDAEYQTPDEFSLRMSRNTQLVLKNEAYLERVADPSGGSYYIENLTNSIAQESWKLFQEIEANGGFVKALKSGATQNAIKTTRTARDMNIATRKDTVLGVNQYPNSSESILSDIKEKHPGTKVEKSEQKISNEDKLSIEFSTEYLSSNDSYIGDLLLDRSNNSAFNIEPLEPYRGAQIFENLRLSTERHAHKTGRTPVVFLLTIGNPSMRSARASFSANFFGCAGYKIINNIGFDTTEDGVKSAIENKADIVVICSSDNEYKDFAPEIINKIKEHNSEIKIIIAGNPKEHLDKLEQAGVDDFIHVRTNAFEMLSKYQNILGIEVKDGKQS